MKADGEALVSKVKGVFAFKVKDANGNDAVWIVDAKNGKGSVEYGGTGERRNFPPPAANRRPTGGQPAAGFELLNLESLTECPSADHHVYGKQGTLAEGESSVHLISLY